MIIRKMTKGDLKEVADIEKEIFSTPWSQKSFQNAIENNHNVYYVAVIDDKIVGYIGIWGVADEGQINNVAVAKEYRNQGICTSILTKVMEECKDRGVVAFTLEVRVSNEAAIRVYEKMGFKNCGIRKNYYKKPEEDAMIMWYGQNPNQ